MGKTELAAHQRQCGAGRAHALKFDVLRSVILNTCVSCRKGLDQRRLWIVPHSVCIYALYGFNRKTAGLLSAFVSAHAIGHNSQAAQALKSLIRIGLPVENRIFVVGALAANVGEPRPPHPRPSLSARRGSTASRCELRVRTGFCRI